MNSKPNDSSQNQSVNDELVLDDSEVNQLAKFLDALLEAEVANGNREATI